MTLIVAITGGIGSGKSTFSKEIKKRRLKLLDSDKEVSLIYKNPNKDFLNYLILMKKYQKFIKTLIKNFYNI